MLSLECRWLPLLLLQKKKCIIIKLSETAAWRKQGGGGGGGADQLCEEEFVVFAHVQNMHAYDSTVTDLPNTILKPVYSLGKYWKWKNSLMGFVYRVVYEF